MNRLLILFCYINLLAVSACQETPDNNAVPQDPSVFQDAAGRTRIYHGVSLFTNDEPGGYTRYNSNGARRLIRDWGINSVRLFWNWHAIEPDSGVFSAEKLEALAGIVETFTNEGVYVVLAVNGTATSSQHLVTGTWMAPGTETVEGYPAALNDKVQESMRRFWDYEHWGYLQDEFIKASQYVAARFRNNPYVLGYDILNEPWGKSQLNTVLNIDFEDKLLPEFYARYISRMRETDPDKYIFFEPYVLFNHKELSNFVTKLPAIPDTRNGAKRLAFAPHNYLLDAAVNSIQGNYGAYLDALRTQYTGILNKQNAPAYIGESANIDYTSFPDWENYLNKHMEAFDAMQASWSYFSYIPGGNNLVQSDDLTENPPVDVICRVYPQAVSGKIDSFRYDPSAKTFHISYRNLAAIGEPTEIFLPPRHFPDGYDLTVAGTDSYSSAFDAERNILKVFVREDSPVQLTVTPN